MRFPKAQPSNPAPSPAGEAAHTERALSHPLPAGMRDILPPFGRQMRDLTEGILDSFERFGYELVSLPAFEYASVLELGLGSLSPDEVLRFVEPESGEVVALRPDVTPQIARLLATRLAGAPMPARLCYEGSVVRRLRERARRHRQVLQAGIELVGLSGPNGDLEVIEAATHAVRHVGLTDFVLDLGDARIAGSLLGGLEATVANSLLEALQLKDQPELEYRAKQAPMAEADRAALSALLELHGGAEVWARAERQLAGTPAEPTLKDLHWLWQAVEQAGLAPKLVVDFAETRHLAYYTGPFFQLHAQGPGRPVGSGGRYDGLLERFNVPLPAAGFAFGLDDLAWALERSGRVPSNRVRALLIGEAPELTRALRAKGVACSQAPAQNLAEYATAWRFTHTLEIRSDCIVLKRTGDETPIRLAKDPATVERVLGSSG